MFYVYVQNINHRLNLSGDKNMYRFDRDIMRIKGVGE